MPLMIETDGTAEAPLRSELDLLVDQISAEEQRSRESSHPAAPGQDIDLLHHQMLGSANALATHVQMRDLHSAMLKVHRKVHQRHELALHHCRLLQSRVRSGAYRGRELVEIITETRKLLARIRIENEQIAHDRRKIRAEHDAFMASLGRGH